MAEVTVRWAPADAPAATAAWLTDAERSRLQGFRAQSDRARFLAAHALVRVVVADRAGTAAEAVTVVQRCPRCGGPHGRPTVVLPGILQPPQISLAHAGTVVVVAVADHPVGIDLEPSTAGRPELEEVLLSEGERRVLSGLARHARPAGLARWWVRKEAVLKAAGVGFDVDPRAVEVTPPGQAPAVIAAPVDLGGPIQLLDLDLEDAAGGAYLASVALRHEHPPTVDARAHGAW